MYSLIKISKEEFENLSEKNQKEYGEFLEDKLEKAKADLAFKDFKFIKEKDYSNFFISAPVYISEDDDKIALKYKETNEQKRMRLLLKKKYKEIHDSSIINKVNPFISLGSTKSGKSSFWIDANEVQEKLGITRKTLYNIQDKGNENNFDSTIINRRLFIDKKSLLNYINNRHYESTNLDIEDMYTKVKELKIALTEKELDRHKKELNKIIESKEYKTKWAKYFKNVPPEERVKRVTPSISVNLAEDKTDEEELNNLKKKNKKKVKKDNIDIYVRRDDDDYFDEYNPNIKICSTKEEDIPKLYQASYWAAVLGVVTRTVLKYCELGYLKYYKIGSKYMISEEDFKYSKEFLDSKRKKTKSNVGRKSKFETLYSDYLLEDAEFREKYKCKEEYLLLYSISEEKEKLEKEIEQLKQEEKDLQSNDKNKKVLDKLEEVDIEIRKKEASIARLNKQIIKEKRRLSNSLMENEEFCAKAKKSVSDYYEIIKSIDTFKKELKKNDDESIETNLKYILADLEAKEEKMRKKIIKLHFL